MSTAKYSGIAVAAANRAALERQEAEAERLRAPKAVDAKEQALLAHLRATMTAESLLGVTPTPAAASRAPAPTPTPRVVASSSGRAALDAQKAVERASRATATAPAARATEKRRMSKAERKRLKRARRRPGAEDDDDDGARAPRRRRSSPRDDARARDDARD